jgi:hypothetical protein
MNLAFLPIYLLPVNPLTIRRPRQSLRLKRSSGSKSDDAAQDFKSDVEVHRMIANASSRLSESNVTHAVSGNQPRRCACLPRMRKAISTEAFLPDTMQPSMPTTSLCSAAICCDPKLLWSLTRMLAYLACYNGFSKTIRVLCVERRYLP